LKGYNQALSRYGSTDYIQLAQPHLELLARKNQTLLVRGDALLVLDLSKKKNKEGKGGATKVSFSSSLAARKSSERARVVVVAVA
jgi:hypothetical protein